MGSGRPQAMAAMWLTVSSAIATKSRSSWVRASYAADYSRLSAWKNEHQVKPKPYMTYNIYIYIYLFCVRVRKYLCTNFYIYRRELSVLPGSSVNWRHGP